MIRILMIDDDADMCDEMTDILESDDFDVTAVCDPLKGLQLAQQNDFDLLLLDLKMPGINGYDILRRVKAMDADMKVMVITGSPLKKIPGRELSPEEKNENKILELADEIVVKSSDIDLILEKIKKLVR